MAYLRGRLYWITLRIRRGVYRKLSTESGDPQVARRIERAIRQCRDRRYFDILEALGAKEITPGDLYDASIAGDVTRVRAPRRDADIEPFVRQWLNDRERRGKTNAYRYENEVRLLIPEGQPFPGEEFTRARIAEHLAPYEHATFNRYRTIFMSFAAYLVEEGVLKENPVRAIRRRSDPRPRCVWYSQADARRVVEWIPSPVVRVAEALMAGGGLEWQAVERLMRSDVDLDNRRVFARGSKTLDRERYCYIMEDWAWQIIAKYVRRMRADRAVVRVSNVTVLKWHKKACKALGLQDSTLHDWRHTHAVTLRKRGVSDTVIAEQLGHHDTTQVAKIYGKFKPDADDYRRALALGLA